MKKFIPILLAGVLVTGGCYKELPVDEFHKYCSSKMEEVTTHFGQPVAKQNWNSIKGSIETWYYLPVSNSTNFIAVNFFVNLNGTCEVR